jgi:hypothetical protein
MHKKVSINPMRSKMFKRSEIVERGGTVVFMMGIFETTNVDGLSFQSRSSSHRQRDSSPEAATPVELRLRSVQGSCAS